MQHKLPQKIIDSFADIRKRIQKAVTMQPKKVTLEQALDQVNKNNKGRVSPIASND